MNAIKNYKKGLMRSWTKTMIMKAKSDNNNNENNENDIPHNEV